MSVNVEDLVELLSSTPCTKDVAQDYLQRGHGIRLPRTSWERMWDRLAEQLGDADAVDAVCELVLATLNDRVQTLIADYEKFGQVDLRSQEPKLADLLFDEDGDLTDLGELVIAYKGHQSEKRPQQSQRRRQKAPGKSSGRAQPRARPKEAPAAHVKLDEIGGDPAGPVSAASGNGFRLEKVRASRGTFLKAKPRWTESDLEEYIVAHWSEIDFGLDQRLTLVGRQVRLNPNSREKVDLYARSGSKNWAIELKIKPASGNDLTQLQSYLQDLAFGGQPAARIGGILIAPAFGEKVLNAALGDPRVVLLRFMLER